ncbi:MAG: response regulator [Burkholderiaceae bacterium]|nr:response regulator [Burkholderiaceae bacterium]
MTTHTQPSATTAEAQPAGTQPLPRVLLVDDQRGRLLAYEAMLEGLGVACVTADSGSKALERVLEQTFAVILLDVNMPDMDGFEVARLVRQHPRYAGTPIIFVTAAPATDVELLKGYQLGAIDYLSMPAAPEVLRSKVAVLVEMHRKRSELESLNRELESARRRGLFEQERRQRALIEEAPIGVAHIALDDKFVYANRSFCALVGRAADELRQCTWQDTTHADDVAAEQSLTQQVLGGLLPHYTLDKRFVRKDGSTVWVQLFGNFEHGDDGRPLLRVVIATDITERKAAEEAMRASEARFRTLANNIDQLAWTCDELGHANWYNERWYDYTGTSAAQMAGDGWKAVVDPAHLDRVMASLRRCLAAGEAWEDTFPLRGKDGQYHWFLSRAVPIRDAAGRVLQWFGTNTDITELKALKSALEEADRRKDEFLAMLAHELRNPVAPIRTAAAALTMLPNGDARKRSLVEVIERQSGTLARILDDLLDVARITQGRIELQREVVPVAGCVEAALQSTAPLMRDKGHRVDVTHANETLHVRADRGRLEQCLTHLLTNAAKFTDARGEISVQVRTDGGDAVIDVRDNGVGIAPAFLPHVFDLFSQGARSIDRSQGGLGLGLAICRQLIELHGGRMSCASEGVGRGATFTLRLPLAHPTNNPASAPISSAPQPKRVLVVDDNRDAADTLALWLQAHGHATQTVYSAEAALQAVDDFAPDVVLLDLGLPGIDGFEVARRIKRDHRSMRVVALTGYGEARDKMMSTAAGFDAHAVKPVDMAELNRLLGCG